MWALSFYPTCPYGSLLMFAKALALCNWVWCLSGSSGVIFSSCRPTLLAITI